MTTPVRRKLKQITLTFDPDGDAAEFQLQVTSWNVNNNTDDGDVVYTFGGPGAGEFREEVDPDYSLSLSYLADWQADGIASYFTEHDGEEIEVELEAHTDVAASPTAPHPKWVGTVLVKAPTAGGDARDTETQEVEFAYIGRPVFSRVTA